MLGRFELAAASVQGKEHRRLGRNNQDAYATYQDENLTVAVVADGCSSGRYNEVGAQIACRTIVNFLADQLSLNPRSDCWNRDSQLSNLFAWLACTTLFSLGRLADELAGYGRNRQAVIQDYCLFTLLGVIIQPELTRFFRIGDGVQANNGRLTVWNFPDNAPPYLGYDLAVEYGGLPRAQQQFEVKTVATASLENFLIGTDGVEALIASASRPLPGKDKTVGELADLWHNDRYFANPASLQRYLTLVNRESKQVRDGRLFIEPGHLADDTTVVVGRLRYAQ